MHKWPQQCLAGFVHIPQAGSPACCAFCCTASCQALLQGCQRVLPERMATTGNMKLVDVSGHTVNSLGASPLLSWEMACSTCPRAMQRCLLAVRSAGSLHGHGTAVPQTAHPQAKCLLLC